MVFERLNSNQFTTIIVFSGTQTYFELVGLVGLHTMSSSYNNIFTNDGTTAEMETIIGLQRNLIGMGLNSGINTIYNATI
ncbi:hypothetical protein CVS40_5539 [Lucilia cuprina]|nr:hypothetical protein CVS40_5539 [Lucilia cuprina]